MAKTSSRFNLNRAQVVDENFVNHLRLRSGDGADSSHRSGDEPIAPGCRLTCRDAIELLESQMTSRMIDIVAREMRARNEGYYTIGSSGHEGNALLGRLARPTDFAFLHYRSGALMAERYRQAGDPNFIMDTMLGMAASADEPIAGGRHKVWGNVALNVPPQTSTIASHLPKAVGAAMSLARARRLGATGSLPSDAIVMCSFGDASVNHAAAQTAINAAARAAHQRLPVPILFVCEDNGLGISVHTPADWIESHYRRRHGLTYFQADGLDLESAASHVQEALDHCRSRRDPVFLHLKVLRLLGHAGSDPETEYHSWQQIEAAESADPLLATAGMVIDRGIMSADNVLAKYESLRDCVRGAAEHAAKTPKLATPADIMQPLAPSTPARVEVEAKRSAGHDERVELFGDEASLPEYRPPRHMAALINLGLHDLLLKYPEAIVFGEDVAKKGGVYHVTTGLTAKFGVGRVFNTVLDETAILGLAIGSAHLGLLPLPEIQYLAYYHNAEDQIRGEACSLQFLSNDQFRNPMVMRIAGWAYQKGFGGHFHNDNSIAALRDVPGLVVASPSRGDDAVKMLRTCLAMAKIDGRVVAFIEPIALYMKRDLYETKDGQWSFEYPAPGEAIPFGQGEIYDEDAKDMTILTFANGTYMSLRAAKTLREVHGVRARVVDLRWLNPLNETMILEQSEATGRVLVVDEGRRTGGVSESILALLCENCGGSVRAARITGHDTFLPLGPAADCVLPAEAGIVAQSLSLLGKG